jgi:uncharacterized protein (TIGR02147 family)
MKSVFSYKDYRSFLGDFYRHQKEQRTGFSFRRFTRDCAVASPNYLKLVIDGKRSLTTPILFRFAKGLGLDFFETQYFEALVHWNQAEDKAERAYYALRLKELRKNKPKSGVSLAKNKMQFEWYVPLVRLLLEGRDAASAPAHVRSQLGKDVPVEKIVEKLLTDGMLAIEDGRYVLKERFNQYRDKTASKVSFELYARRHLEHVLENFSTLYPRGRFVVHSFTAGKERFEFFSSLISRLILDINKHAEGDPSDQLYDLNIQFLPHQGDLRLR